MLDRLVSWDLLELQVQVVQLVLRVHKALRVLQVLQVALAIQVPLAALV